MANVPVVFVSIPHGGAAGNVLRAGLVGRLLDAHEQPDVVQQSLHLIGTLGPQAAGSATLTAQPAGFGFGDRHACSRGPILNPTPATVAGLPTATRLP